MNDSTEILGSRAPFFMAKKKFPFSKLIASEKSRLGGNKSTFFAIANKNSLMCVLIDLFVAQFKRVWAKNVHRAHTKKLDGRPDKEGIFSDRRV